MKRKLLTLLVTVAMLASVFGGAGAAFAADVDCPDYVGQIHSYFLPGGGGETTFTQLSGGATYEEVTQAFRDEYIRMTGEGYDYGSQASGEPYVTWMEGTLLYQEFVEGDSTADWYGRTDCSIIVFNPSDKKAYTVKDDFLLEYGLGTQYGYPTSAETPLTDDPDGYVVQQTFQNGVIRFKDIPEELGETVGEAFVIGEVTYQNYQYGYSKTEGDATEYVYGKNAAAEEGALAENLVDMASVVGAVSAADETLTEEQKAALKAEFGRVYAEKFEEGYNMGAPLLTEGDLVVDLFGETYIQLFIGGDGEGENTSLGQEGMTAIAYNTDQQKAYLLEGVVLTAYISDYAQLGMPISVVEEVPGEENVRRQRFEIGYIRIERDYDYDENDQQIWFEYAVVRSGYHIADDGEVTLISDIENVGVISDSFAMPAEWEGVTEEIITQAFKDAYNELFNEGYHPGFASTPVEFWGDMLKQNFIGGDSTGSTFDVSLLISFNPEDKKAYVVRDGCWDGIANNGANGVLYPLGNQFTLEDGTIVQNFAAGYIILPEGDARQATFKTGEFYDINNPPTDEGDEPGTDDPGTGGGEEQQGGCAGSVMAVSAAASLVPLAAAFGLALKKKKSNH